MEDIESQSVVDTKEPMKERCFEFWFVKHPLRFLCLWIIMMFCLAVIISENSKNSKND
jgi:hypothetical protein